jgi:hypothetical protein
VFQLTEYGDVVSSAPIAFPSHRKVTPATPLGADAVAVTEVVPLTLAPETGDEIVTAGAALFTFTVTSVEVAVAPPEARTIAVRVCVPLLRVVVFQLTE